MIFIDSSGKTCDLKSCTQFLNSSVAFHSFVERPKIVHVHFRDMHNIMVNIIGNGLGNPSSNPGQGCLYFT